MVAWIHSFFTPYAHSLPLELFAFFASFFEEAIPPIPAFPVMVMAGSFAKLQDYSLVALFALALLSAFGKTLGAVLVYRVVDRLEDVFMRKYSSYLGLENDSFEKFGRKLTGGKIDYLIMIALRALPIIPSTLISVGSGLLTVPMKLFIISTYIGTIFRDSLYLYIGFIGTKAFNHYLQNSIHLNLHIKILSVALLISYIAYLYLRHRKKQKQSKSTLVTIQQKPD